MTEDKYSKKPLNIRNIKEGVSELVKSLGVVRISSRRIGHFDYRSINKIREEYLPTIYEDLILLKKRLGVSI